MRTVIRLLWLALLFSPAASASAATDLTDTLRVYLQQHLEAENVNAAIMVGMVDEHGCKVIGCGELDNGADEEANGGTIFEIGSDTKTFTALLLQDMVRRGEMKLDDPVSKHLPSFVRMPTYRDRKITLRHLATHTSGLPVIPDNLVPQWVDNPYANYTSERLYVFLSGYKLSRAPGAKAEYSNLGMGLLGHAISLRAGMNYESLVVDRICRPLMMDSTRITLTPEQQSRFAMGHNLFGEPTANWDIPVLSGAGALRSTANDLVKYLSANLGLKPSALTPLMKRTYENRLAWFVDPEVSGTKIISHGGGTGGSQSFVGFDLVRRRGVVILFNGRRVFDVEQLGKSLLRIDWRAGDRRVEFRLGRQVPKLFMPSMAIQLQTKDLDAIAGAYEFGPSAARPGVPEMKLSVRREGDQLIGQASGRDVIQGAFVLHPESETNFVIKLNGAQLAFIKNDKGDVIEVIHHEAELPGLKGKKSRKLAR